MGQEAMGEMSLSKTLCGMTFKNISDQDQMKIMNNKDKIQTINFIRKQTLKKISQKNSPRSSFPPVVGGHMFQDGFAAEK